MIQIRPCIYNGEPGWEVDLGLINGKRVRKYKRTEEEAKEVAEAELKARRRNDPMGTLLTPSQRAAAARFFLKVRDAGLTLDQVWENHLAWENHRKTRPVVQSVSFAEAIEEFKRRKVGVGKDERYIEETAKLLLRFAKGRESRLISEFTADELETWFNEQGWAKSTRKANMGRFSSLWTVALQKRWVAENIVDRLEPVGKLSFKPEYFDHNTCQRLMTATMANDEHKRVLAPLVLGLFVGMRPEEANNPKFGWHKIDLERGIITVEDDVAKTGDRRVIHLHPTAIEWLKLAKQFNNPLPPVNERRLVDSMCRLAGIEEWPKDVLRKTAATHLVHYHRNYAEVVLEMGNSISILLKHYAGLVDEKTSAKHWEITPEAVSKLNLTELRAFAAPPPQSASGSATGAD